MRKALSSSANTAAVLHRALPGGDDEWPNFLGNRPMMEALLSRLRHYCHTVHIDGPSLRPPQS
jgi:hypothetical protein